MRDEIISLLKKSSPAPLSGEAIAQQLGISRTAVWKNMRALQEKGYNISGSPRRGYLLQKIPDLLYPVELGEKLHTKVIAPNPSFIHHYHRVGSTNNVLKEMAEKGAPEGTVVVAELQEEGRGRMGRHWSSPEGKGIYLSLLLRPAVSPQYTSPLTLLAAVAACGGISSVLPRLSPGIKWPNDLLIGGRKVCGILCEIKAEIDLVHYLVAGIGINVNMALEDFPPELQHAATSLRLENEGAAVSRLAVAAGVLHHFDELYTAYLQEGAASVMARWREYNITLGRSVKVQGPGFSFAGTARELDGNGALVVESESGERKSFTAGEVIMQ